MMSLKILMTKILLLTEKANVTQMQPKKVRQLSRIIIFLKKITMKKAMFPPHAWHKDQKKDFPYTFRTEKHKKTHTFFCVGIIKYFLNLSSLPGRIITPTIFLITAKKESTFEVRIALSVQEAMDIIKQHEIENTVRFSIYSSTKEFGSTGKRFHYKVSIIYFNKRILICRNILYGWSFQLQNYRCIVSVQCNDRITDIRSVDMTQCIIFLINKVTI